MTVQGVASAVGVLVSTKAFQTMSYSMDPRNFEREEETMFWVLENPPSAIDCSFPVYSDSGPKMPKTLEINFLLS